MMLSDVYCGVSTSFCCLCRLKGRNLIVCRWTFLPHFDVFFDPYIANKLTLVKKKQLFLTVMERKKYLRCVGLCLCTFNFFK